MFLYRYLCKMRPPAPGSVPKRNLHSVIPGRIHMDGGGHALGMAYYTEPLTDEEIEMYELEPYGAVYDDEDEEVIDDAES